MGAVSQAAKDRQAKAREELRAMYKEHGICPRCKNWAEPGRIYCKACINLIMARRRKKDPDNEQGKAYNRERRERLKAAGICTNCGKKPAVKNQVLCPACKAKNRDSQIKYNIIQRIKREAQKARERNGNGNNP